MTTRPQHRLLSRDDFRNGVFARDNGRCVICGVAAVDAHHILERKLWADGGYYLANGASLCEEHHLAAERTELSCEQVRAAAGIAEPFLPDHLPLDERYDKWGNPILASGQRLRGEIFFDKGAQLMLASVLSLFTNRVKPHRTLHLPWSRSVGDDDRVLASLDSFAGEEVVVTAKMDGRGTKMMRDLVYAKSIAGVSGPGTSRIKALHATIAQHIPEDFRLCGEDMQVEHSIAYRNLRAFFYLFAAWDERNHARSWDETQELATMLDLVPVPVLYRGPWSAEEIRALGDLTELDGDPLEGYVVRVTRAFSAGETPRTLGLLRGRDARDAGGRSLHRGRVRSGACPVRRRRRRRVDRDARGRHASALPHQDGRVASGRMLPDLPRLVAGYELFAARNRFIAARNEPALADALESEFYMSKRSIIIFETGPLKFRCEGGARWTAKQLDKLLHHLHHLPSSEMASSETKAPAIVVVQADVARYACDVLVLKYARSFYGADLDVAGILAEHAASTGFDRESFALQPGEHRFVPGEGSVGAKSVLFVGVSSLESFGYDQIREFAARAIQVASQAASTGVTVAMTIHGVGFGLDEHGSVLIRSGALSN